MRDWMTVFGNRPPDLDLTLAQAQQNTYSQVTQAPARPKFNPHDRALNLLFGRLNGVHGGFSMTPEDFLYTHVLNDTVHIFFLFKGKAGHTEEGVDLFPSDTLITQLRLIMS